MPDNRSANHADQTNDVADLVRLAQTGDKAAFDRLAARVLPVLRARALYQTRGNHDEAGDLAQEICVRLWRGLPSLQSPEAFWTWLQTLSASVWADRLRRTKRELPSVALDDISLPTRNADDSPHFHLLRRETGRELFRALHSLPRANREALLWHVWGNVSYEGIARLVSVPVSTVEGRIYRAKRQMRRLLPAFGEFLSKPVSCQSSPPALRKKVFMPVSPVSDASATPAAYPHLPFALVVFVQRLAALVDGGVSLSAALESLHDLPAPYGGDFARDMARRVRKGELPSHLMEEGREKWGPFLIALVQVGETGGVLDEVLRRAAALLTREYQMLRPASGPSFDAALLSAQTPPGDWETLSPYQKTVTRFTFCASLSVLLASSVSLGKSLLVCAAFLPPFAQAALCADAESTMPETLLQVLANLRIFPPFVAALLQASQNGTLPFALDKVAEAFEQELACF